MRPRLEILEDLLKYKRDLRQLKIELRQYPIDLGEGEHEACHTRQDILDVLERYFKGEISDLQLNEWADSIAFREDVDNEKGYNEVINTVLQEIARDLLIDPLLPREEVVKLAEQLRTTPFDPNED